MAYDLIVVLWDVNSVISVDVSLGACDVLEIDCVIAAEGAFRVLHIGPWSFVGVGVLRGDVGDIKCLVLSVLIPFLIGSRLHMASIVS